MGNAPFASAGFTTRGELHMEMMQALWGHYCLAAAAVAAPVSREVVPKWWLDNREKLKLGLMTTQKLQAFVVEFARYYPSANSKRMWEQVRELAVGDAIGWRDYKRVWAVLIRSCECVASPKLLRKAHLRAQPPLLSLVPRSTVTVPLLLNWIHDDIERGVVAAPDALPHWRALLASLSTLRKSGEQLLDEMRVFVVDVAAGDAGLRRAKLTLRNTRAAVDASLAAIEAVTPHCAVLRLTRVVVFDQVLALMESVREHKHAVRKLFQRRLDQLTNSTATVSEWDWQAERWKEADHSKLFLPDAAATTRNVEEGASALPSSSAAGTKSSMLNVAWLDVLAQPHLDGSHMESLIHLRESLSELALSDMQGGGLDTVGVALGQMSRLRTLLLVDSGLEEDQVKGMLHSSSATLDAVALFDHQRWDLVHPVKMSFPSKKLSCGSITTLVIRNHRASINLEALMEGLRLRYLDLSGNTLERGLAHISATQRDTLAQLVLEACDLDALPYDFASLQRLVVLMLAGNRLASVPHFVYSLPDLVTLDLRDNLVLRVDHVLPSGRSLRNAARLSLLLLPPGVDRDSVARVCPQLRLLRRPKNAAAGGGGGGAAAGAAAPDHDEHDAGSPMKPLTMKSAVSLGQQLAPPPQTAKELRYVREV